jgi:hypothetical protein
VSKIGARITCGETSFIATVEWTSLIVGARHVRIWPIGLATAAARHGRLPRGNLPAATPFVNPHSAHHGRRREAGGASIIPPDATASAEIKRPLPRRRACRRDRRGSASRASAPPRGAWCRRRVPTAALGRMSVPGTIALDSSGDATVLALAPTGIGPGMTARHGIERLALHGGTPRRAPRA